MSNKQEKNRTDDSVGAHKTLKFRELNQQQKWRESSRLTIAGALVAFAVGTLYLLPDDLITQGLALALRLGVGFSGVFSFIYILSTGSHLKYKEPGYINAIFVTDGMRRTAFDLAIESFAGGFLFAFVGAMEILIVKAAPSTERYAIWIAWLVGYLVFKGLIVLNYKRRDKEQPDLNRY